MPEITEFSSRVDPFYLVEGRTLSKTKREVKNKIYRNKTPKIYELKF